MLFVALNNWFKKTFCDIVQNKVLKNKSIYVCINLFAIFVICVTGAAASKLLKENAKGQRSELFIPRI